MSITLNKESRFYKKNNPVLSKDFIENELPVFKTYDKFTKTKSIFPALVQYKGGGYDGCFWEPNFCFVDWDYEDKQIYFEDIGSSGYYKIKDEENLYRRLKDFTEEDEPYSNSSNFYFFQIPKENCKNYKAKLNELAKDIETNVNQMYTHTIFQYFQDLGIEIKQSCGVCKERFYEVELTNAIELGYGKSAGGLAITTDELPVCEDCLSSHSCSVCGQFYGYSEDENEKDFKWMSEGDGCISCEPIEEKEEGEGNDSNN